MNTITRKLEFDAGHRVLGHGGKCRHLHGHRYVLELTVTAAALNPLGMVIDYSVLKSVVGKWIDDNLDHNFIAHPDDPLLMVWAERYVGPVVTHQDCDTPFGRVRVTRRTSWAQSDLDGARDLVFGGKKPFVMPAGENPTAENLAKFLFDKAEELLKEHGVGVVNVRLFETVNCWADYARQG